MKLRQKPLAAAITLIGYSAAGLLSLGYASPSDASDLSLEEIVVTAQKREQSLQDVPIAVTAISADQLQQSGSITLSDVANITPGLNLSNTQSEESTITMRGIGSNDFGFGSDDSIPVYLDGVYMGNGAAIVGDLMDVSQIEVLKGPQGTLFGRNAVGGAVSVTTSRPTEDLEGSINLGMGNYDLKTAKGVINLPLIDDELFVRISAAKRDRDGWQKNIATDKQDGFAQDRWNSRVKFLWLAADDLELEFTSDWQQENDHAGYGNIIQSPFAPWLSEATLNVDGTKTNNGNAYFGLDSNGLPDTSGPDGRPVDFQLNRKMRGNALKITWDISDTLTLTSISSYRELRSAISEDADGSEFLGLNVRAFLNDEEYSQEFRLNGGSETIDWFVGLSAYRKDGSGKVDNSFGPLVTGAPFDEVAMVDTKTESYALFGDAIWQLTDTTNLTFGLRYSYDAKSQNIKNPNPFGLLFASADQLLDESGNIDPSRANSHENWSDLSPRVVVDHQINDDIMIYAGVSQGYKSGGFNSFPTVNTDITSALFGLVPAGSTEPFDEEKITNFEAGFKSSLLENRLRLNGSLFYYKFEDLQFLVAENAVVRAENAGEAIGQGLDLEITYLLTENLAVSANMGWLNSEYGSDLIDSNGDFVIRDGQDLAYAPHFSGNVSLDYSMPLGDAGELRGHINYAHTGKKTHNGTSTDAIYKEDAIGLLSARVSYFAADGSWELGAWGTNLTNEDVIESFGGVTDDFGFVAVRRGEPRMIGVDFQYNY